MNEIEERYSMLLDVAKTKQMAGKLYLCLNIKWYPLGRVLKIVLSDFQLNKNQPSLLNVSVDYPMNWNQSDNKLPSWTRKSRPHEPLRTKRWSR